MAVVARVLVRPRMRIFGSIRVRLMDIALRLAGLAVTSRSIIPDMLPGSYRTVLRSV